MKKIFLAFIFLFTIHGISHAQADSSAPYRKDPNLPYFKILQGDSTWFSKYDIPKNKYVVMIYFSPDCSHCQHTAEAFADSMNLFKNTFFVWVSFHTPPQIKTFAHQYKLDQFDNVRLGRDTSYYIPSFFQVRFTPFMAVYNPQGKLVQAFEGGEKPSTIAKYSEAKF
jgi:thioredoxin-related protein